MNIQDFHERLKKIETMIESKGVSGEAYLFINWLGDEIRLTVVASEPWDENGHWKREKHFDGKNHEAERLLSEAEAWAYVVPGEEDRTIELMIQKLNEIADKLPKGSSAIAMRAWEEVHNMLMARAGSLAKNGLPSPVTISNIGGTK